VAHGFVEKSGAWYSYGSDRIGQGKDNVREFLKQNPDIAGEIEAKLRAKLLVTSVETGGDVDEVLEAEA
jgi:recombination protein RecA